MPKKSSKKIKRKRRSYKIIRHSKQSRNSKKGSRPVYKYKVPAKRGRRVRTATKYSKSRERISAQRKLVDLGGDKEVLLNELVESGKKRGFVTDSELDELMLPRLEGLKTTESMNGKDFQGSREVSQETEKIAQEKKINLEDKIRKNLLKKFLRNIF